MVRIDAGAYNRPLMMRNAGFFVETEADVNVVDIQTHTVFVDIRIPTRFKTAAKSFAELSLSELCELAKQHCFAGYSVIDSDVSGYEGLPVCNRLHSIDFAPAMRHRSNNQWRIQPEFERGGWVELGAIKDEFGQASYVEHWSTLPRSRDGPFVALRRVSPGMEDAMLVIAGSTFGFIVDRPQLLEASNGHRSVQELVRSEAMKPNPDRKSIELMLSLECSVGDIDGPNGEWNITRSTYPWLEGSPLFGAKATRSLTLNHGTGKAVLTASDGTEETWDVFEIVGITLSALAEMFRRADSSSRL
eukprot:SAG31_NODE_3779_length_3889_cov_3.666227_1_plen_303_part_00